MPAAALSCCAPYAKIDNSSGMVTADRTGQSLSDACMYLRGGREPAVGGQGVDARHVAEREHAAVLAHAQGGVRLRGAAAVEVEGKLRRHKQLQRHSICAHSAEQVRNMQQQCHRPCHPPQHFRADLQLARYGSGTEACCTEA